jgi:tRNA1(Val) A37 N6-methylase TrmN6
VIEAEDDPLTSDAITGDFRLIQRKRGHRFSLDDLATAYVAAQAAPGAATYADLGCGVGSVLLMVSWRLRSARVLGVEAQEVSIGLARRNVAENGLGDRVRLVHGDLREVTRELDERFELVTGTPPYLPRGTAVASPDPQRAAARIELRGGIEDYLAGAARVVAPGGRVVVCADGRRPDRVATGARSAGLAVLARLDVAGRAGDAGPLFAVWTLAPEAAGEPIHDRVAMRDEAGARTAEAVAMRRFFGLDAG